MTRPCAFTLLLASAVSAPFCLGQMNAPTPPTPPGAPNAPLILPAPRAPRTTNARSYVFRSEDGNSGSSSMGIVPPGTWWRNQDTIKNLSLSPDQQKKMDDIFRQNRIQLVDLKASLEKEQINLEPMLNNNPPDQGRTLAEISRIADLRADLEKANAKMLLALRGVLTSDQWTKLQADRPDSFKFMRAFPGAAFAPSGSHRSTTTTICTSKDGQTTPSCTTTHGGGSSDLKILMPEIRLPDLDKLLAPTMAKLSTMKLPDLSNMPDLSNLKIELPQQIEIDLDGDDDTRP